MHLPVSPGINAGTDSQFEKWTLKKQIRKYEAGPQKISLTDLDELGAADAGMPNQGFRTKCWPLDFQSLQPQYMRSWFKMLGLQF